MATEGGGTNRSPPTGVYPPLDDPNPLKTLYPMVNEKETPLPRAWSMKDKYSFIGLSQNNLRVHYKASPATGHGKTHKDAASVRATHPIPASCGLYYFEIRVVSKGRDGYMGIGLSAQGVSMNRLPGWDRNSYGYHGDDGHSFCSTGSGQPYGPTFTTGDVVGCGLNLVDRTCFYTKNGVMLGTAFSDLSDKLLYPTVGLQTPGEIIDANFGLSGPFVFDLRIKMGEIREKVRKSIIEHPITLGETVINDNGDKGRWNDVLHKMVSGYLVHHGYSNTAEAFSRATHMSFNEEIASIKNRQRISNLIMNGDVGGAISVVQQLYPDLLEQNKNLLFLLKVRQFIEIVNGTEQDCESQCTNGEVHGKVHHTSVIQSTKAALAKGHINEHNRNTRNSSEPRGSTPRAYIEDSDSEMMEFTEENRTNSPPKESSEDRTPSNGVSNGFNKHTADSQETTNLPSDSNGVAEGVPYLFTAMKGYSEERKKKHVDNVLSFGRELQAISLDLKKTQGKNKTNKKMLQDAFSLLAYTDPANSPVGWQLNPSMREPVCQALNSAILELQNLPARPALEVSAGHAQQLIEVMLKCCMGSAALTNLPNILNYQPKPFVPARDEAKETSSSDVSNLETSSTPPPNISSSTSNSNLSLKNNSTRTTISSSGEKRSAASLSGNEYYSCSGDGSGVGVLGTSSSFPPSVVDTALRQRNFSSSYHQDFILNSSTPVDFQASQDMEHAPADFYQAFPSTSSYSTDNSDYYYSYMSSDNQTDLASTSYLSNSAVVPHYNSSSDHIGSMSMTSAALTSASATLVASGTSLDDVEPLESEALEPMERLETMALGDGGGGSLSLGVGTVSSSESSSTTSSTAQLTFSQHDSIDGSSMSESHWLPSNDQ